MVYNNMILFKITEPTVAEIYNYQDILPELRKQLTYKDLTATYALNKHKTKDWLKRKDPVFFEEETSRLQQEIYKNLFFQKNGKLCTYPGVLPYLTIPYKVENLVEYPKLKAMPWAKPIPFEPYFYQNQSMEELLNIKHGHVSLPTGAGKTLILMMLARNSGLRTVISTPSQSIFSELLEQFEKHLGKGRVGAYGDGKKDLKKNITIAINKSLSMVKEGSEAWEFFSNKQMLLIDESHQMAAEELSRTAYGVLKDIPYRMFLSGTQVRSDGKQILLNSIIGPCVLEMSIKEAMDKKFLCPLKFKIIKTYTPSKKYITDPVECKREHFLRNPNISDLVAKLANANWNVKSESTLILVEELSQISSLVSKISVPFTYVHSASKKESEANGINKVDVQDEIERFNNGEVKVLIGTKCIFTGVNFYPTHNSINWAGGSSEVVTKQGVMGRSTRKLENSPYKDKHKAKPFTTVFDFDVTNNTILNKQLQKRIQFYEETGETVVY